ncbi:MAG: ATP-binding protein [Legionellaceae bacterium]|nr:ATP-binding protein [Legionellaceae bacterium]
MAIVGREKEVGFLNHVFESRKPEFLAIYGRRRVGKTYLIREFFKDKGIYFELTGIKDATKSSQLKNFSTVYSDTFLRGDRIPPPKDWDDALNVLRIEIEKTDESKKIIIFFDELPWLASRKSGFLEALDLFWNRYMSSRENIILVICGSAAEWMIKKIISNKGGLHNRLTQPPVNLMPFTLKQTKQYLDAIGVHLEQKQVIDLYMALGGVAYYLSLVSKGKSSSQVISDLFFANQAPLLSEFRNLFDSLYDNPQKHIDVIKLLAQTRQGLTQTDIFNKVKNMSPGGGAVLVLEELENCGFVHRVHDFGKKKKDARYRLIDGFTLFYLKWVEGQGEFSEHFWMRKKGSASYNTWAGYAFENLCFLHYRDILRALEITVVAEAKSGWRYLPLKADPDEGAQIDLVIDRADKCINLCEIKFYDDELMISKAYAQVLRRKKSCFKEKTGTRKTLFMTMITTYGVKMDQHYLEVVDGQIKMDALFE